MYWRSLGELADTLEFREYLHREFPEQASEWNDPKGRRQFLKLMSASLALAGVGACTRQPPEPIVPYVRQPEDIVPGRPLFFASAIPMSGVAQPVLVESHMGRPTKIEGNPQHPASLGATDAITQAAVLELYDPDRAKTITVSGAKSRRGARSSREMQTACPAAEGPAGRRPALPDRPDHLAVAGRVDGDDSRASTRRPGGISTIPSPATARGSAAAGGRLADQRHLPLRQGRRRRRRSTPISWRADPAACATRRTSRPGGA